MLLERPEKDIISGPTLSRPDPYQWFYINTDWSKGGMGAVIMQVYDSVEERKAYSKEKSEKCEFDKSLEVMRLRPIYFISRSTVSPLENSRHSF